MVWSRTKTWTLALLREVCIKTVLFVAVPLQDGIEELTPRTYTGCYMRFVCFAPHLHNYDALTYVSNPRPPIQHTFTAPALIIISVPVKSFARMDDLHADYHGSRFRRHHGTGLFRTTIDEHFGNSLPIQSSASSSTSTSEFRCDPLPYMVSTTMTV